MKYKKTEKLRKAISVVTLYAVFIQQIIPYGFAAVTHPIQSNSTYSNSDVASSSEGIELSDSKLEELVEANPGIEQQLQVAMSTSSGGGQAESGGFSIGSTDGMVDKFTGDFSYSIPLMDVEGYPIVLSYNSNVSMNSEASWVGLGWDLNVGAVSREMRGIPDEFNGEQTIDRTFNQLDATTTSEKYGGFVSLGYDIGLGKSKLAITPSIQLTRLKGTYNSSYLGLGRTLDIGLQAQLSLGNEDGDWSLGPTFGIGYSRDSKNGIGTSSQFGLSAGKSLKEDPRKFSISYGKSYNSRIGITSKSINSSFAFGAIIKQDKFSVGGSSSLGTGTSITYGTATMVPKVSLVTLTNGNQITWSYENSVKFPNGLKIGYGTIDQTGTTENTVVTNSSNQIFQPAIGYFHSGKRDKFSDNDFTKPIMDYNTSGVPEYSEKMAYLDFSAQTYDVFRVNASGNAGTFRGRRTDIGTYYDANSLSETAIRSVSPSGEVTILPVGVTFSLGVTGGVNSGEQESGIVSNSSTSLLEFEDEAKSNSFDQSVYFKSVGEPTPEDHTALAYMGGESAAYFRTTKTSDEIGITNTLKPNNASQVAIVSSTLNGYTDKIVRANQFVPSTVSDLTGASNDSIYLFTQNDFSYGSNVSAIHVGDAHRADNHLSSIQTVTNSGTRYIYGLPAYNLSSSTVSFAATGLTVDANTGLVDYNAVDASINNTRGRSHYYDKNTVPAYAHSFLLTQMLSSDYIDVENDGPTIDDIGSYYKFNYTQAYGEDTDTTYKWRFPACSDGDTSAFFNKGTLGSTLDDKGNYSFGEKEIWYVHTVESKNFIAEFYLADRYDAYGANDEHGGLNLNTPLKYLEKIVLYNKSDREDGGYSVPVQIVEFEYNYSLCPLSPSNKHSYSGSYNISKSGKLTLKAIRVRSGESHESALATYEFTYSDQNPKYNIASVDGWGNYKWNDTDKPNDLYPYSSQDADSANLNVQSWKLVSIKTPMGGQMDVEYEADRFGHVQNKKAMRHFKIHGMTDIIHFLKIKDNGEYNGSENTSSNYTTSITDTELTNLGGSTFKDKLNAADYLMSYEFEYGQLEKSRLPNNVIIFKLEDEYSDTLSYDLATTQVRNEYFSSYLNATGSDRRLYLKAHSEVDADGNVEDFIPLFANISEDHIGSNNAFNDYPTFDDEFYAMGVMPYEPGENYKYGYVIIDPTRMAEQSKKEVEEYGHFKTYAAHPIQKAVVQYARSYLPDVIYGACVSCIGDLTIDNEMSGKKDADRVMMRLGYASKLDTALSLVRLQEPDGIKFGGNARVKKITYSDNWNTISGEYASTYSWTYEYANRVEETGVAAHETGAILDENPMYTWLSYENIVDKFANESKFTPTPIGNILYPNPTVGYEKVQVRFEGAYDKGYSESEFHTSKTHPTQWESTKINKTNRIEKKNILTGASTNLYGLSQGYSLITNDYHGRPLAQRVFNKYGDSATSADLISETVYEYYGEDDKVKMINRDGILSEEKIAVEYDMHCHSNYVTNNSYATMIGVTVSLTLPTPFVMVMPNFFKSHQERGFYSNVLVKHINKSAVVKNVQTNYLGSKNNAANLAYDYETGNVLITCLQDEYDDSLYSFNYPAHWYYDQFRSRTEVEGLVITGGNISGQSLTTNSSLPELFVEGDHLELDNGTSTAEAWILSISGTTATLIESTGAVFDDLTGSVTVTMLNSGRENRLMESIQSMVTKKAPDLSVGAFSFPEDEIISSSAISYRNRNNVKCKFDVEGMEATELAIGSVANPYIFGIRGKLVPDRQYAWQSPRINATHEHGTRFDGTYSTFVPFYKIDSEEWHQINELSHPDNIPTDSYQKWRQLGETTLFDQYGKALESTDQIDIHSTVLYGYNSELEIVPVAQAVNARKQEIAFDGFEDYTYYNNSSLGLDETHFNFSDALTTGISISNIERHSGISSLRVNATKTASLTKSVGTIWTNPTDGMNDSTFVVDTCLCIPVFEPTPGKYVLGAWVKVGESNPTMTLYDDAQIEVEVTHGVTTSTYEMNGSGPIIDGWQRVEGTFVIPSDGTSLEFRLVNLSSTEEVYFDDIRIHPFLAGMTTVVYDPNTLLPLATHDGYNFTTFYGYDENLNQVRIKVETIEGIKTIMESEFGGQKSFK